MRIKFITVAIVQEGNSDYSIITELPKKMSTELAIDILEKAIQDLKSKDTKKER